MTKPVDVGARLDGGEWTSYQKWLVLGVASTIVVDGVDNQLLPNAVPALMAEWGLPRSAFANILAAGPFGMVVGSLAGGIVGDRVGRRTALLGSVIIFGLLTLLVSFAESLEVLVALRFLAGVGLGGAMPNAAALTAEYVPARHRSLAVTLTIVCIPLGGTLAALLAGWILPVGGWRALFVVGGLVPIVWALLLWRTLPESPRYLATRRPRWGELAALLARMGHHVPPDAEFIAAASAGSTATGGSVRALFAPALALDTVGLFGAFFFCLMANYIGFQLIPTVVGGAGFPPLVGTNANAAFNFGGVAGAVIGGFAIPRLGSRVTMLGMSALAVVSALVMAATPLTPSDGTVWMLVMFAVTGGLLNAVVTTTYALAAHVYPVAIRAAGVGMAVAFGRLGNVLAVYVGNAALDLGGAPGYFSSWAITMTLVLTSLALVRRHIAPVPRL